MKNLALLSRSIDRLNEGVGRAVSWLALAMVLVMFWVVLLRYVFGLSFIWMQEGVTYMHGLLFMVGAGYTLLKDGHVRVDVIYSGASDRFRAWVNLGGAVLFLLPFCAILFTVSWPYVASAWAVLEGSKETSGIQAVYLLKTALLLFAGLVGLQGLSMIARSILVLADRVRPPEPAPNQGDLP